MQLLEDDQAVHVTFTGEFGTHRVSPRLLSSSHLNELVEVRGIVTRCTLVRPKIVRSVHYCPATGAFSKRSYRDVTSNDGLPTPAVYPTRDDQGNLLTTQFGLSQYVDEQTVTIQELPETAPPGQLPRSGARRRSPCPRRHAAVLSAPCRRKHSTTQFQPTLIPLRATAW